MRDLITSWEVSRNALCPCGSQKKFKHCCQRVHESKLRISEIDEKLNLAMMRFLAEKMGGLDLDFLWEEFTHQDDNSSFDPHSAENQLFFPWLLFHWDWSEFVSYTYPSNEEEDSTVAMAFSYEALPGFTEKEQKIFWHTLDSNFSFYEILRSDPGMGILVKDILMENKSFYVREYSASQTLEKGNIIFAKMLKIKDLNTMQATGSASFPPQYKIQIIDFREQIKNKEGRITEEQLWEYSDEIIDFYQYLRERLFSPHQLCNTDGDPLEFHEIVFKIKSTDKAFQKLNFLADGHPAKELLEEAQYDANGNLSSVAFNWLKPDQNDEDIGTAFGKIHIDQNKLFVEVNSENRANKIKDIILKKLGTQVEHLSTKKHTMEELTAKMQPGSMVPEKKDPALIQIEEELMANHWKKWIDMEIPALNGLTPRQAAKNKVGREKLTALLVDFEMNCNTYPGGEAQLKYILETKKTLGIE